MILNGCEANVATTQLSIGDEVSIKAKCYDFREHPDEYDGSDDADFLHQVHFYVLRAYDTLTGRTKQMLVLYFDPTSEDQPVYFDGTLRQWRQDQPQGQANDQGGS